LTGDADCEADDLVDERLAQGRSVPAASFSVPIESARAPITEHTSFNLVDEEHALKIDVFVLGDGLLDRRSR
jgi:hypothetical protein